MSGIALSTMDLRWPIGALCACMITALLLRAYLAWSVRADRARADRALRHLGSSGEPRGTDAPPSEHDG